MPDPTDPFKEARESCPVAKCEFQNRTIPMLLRHEDVREAARDWKTFSSDAPFRVPIPSEETVRSERQLPIETDPPEHTEYRRIIEPFFLRPRETAMREWLAELIRSLLAQAMNRDSIEVIREFALPLQARALAYLLGVPESEADEWMSWGLHVFKPDEPAAGSDTGLSTDKGKRLDRYIRRKLDEAAATGTGDDYFSVLSRAEFRGRRLTREEMVGFTNLVFAGGRDTIIQTVAGILFCLAERPGAFEELRARPELLNAATEEFLRYLSPLTHLGRVCPHETEVHGTVVPADERVSLCFASANRDASVFEAPEELRLDRKPNPHLAFGSGPHICIGAVHTRAIVRELLQALCATVARVEILEEHPNVEQIAHFRRQVGYERLVLRLIRRAPAGS